MKRLFINLFYLLIILIFAFIPSIIPGGIPVYDAIASAQRSVMISNTTSYQAQDFTLQSVIKSIEEYWNNFDIETYATSQAIKILPRFYLPSVDYDSLNFKNYINSFVSSDLSSQIGRLYDLIYLESKKDTSSEIYDTILNTLGYPTPVNISFNTNTTNTYSDDNIFNNSFNESSKYIKDPSGGLLAIQSSAITDAYATSAQYLNAHQNFERYLKIWQADVGAASSNPHADQKTFLKLMLSFQNMTSDYYKLQLINSAIDLRIKAAQLATDYSNTLGNVNTRRSSYLYGDVISNMLDDINKQNNQ